MRRTMIVCLALMTVGGAGVAWPAEGKNALRFGGGYVMPSGDLTEPLSFAGVDLGDGTMLAFDGQLTLEPQAAAAFALGYERRFTDRLGLEAMLLRSKLDVDGRLQGTYWINDSTTGMLIDSGPLDETEGVGDVSFTPLTLGVNFHLTPRSRVDFYVAPVVGYVLYGDLDVSGDALGLKDDFAFGATAGIDVPLSKGGWSLNVALRYLAADAEPDDSGAGIDALDVNPSVIQVAAGYRF